MRRGENIYKRKDGRWEGRVKKGYQADGRIKYRYIYGKTFQEVRTKLYSLKAYYLTNQTLRGDACIPFEEWSRIWLSEIQNDIKPSTFSSYQYKLSKYVFPYIGNTYLNELTSESGKELLTKWLELGLAPSSIRVIVRIISNCLNKAKDKKKINDNPFLELKLPKTNPRKIRSLTRKEQSEIETIALTEKKNSGLPTYLALYTGLRIGEISALRWSDIDFDRNIIHVNHTYQRISLNLNDRKTQLIIGSTKTNSGTRSVPVGQKLRKLLLNHRKNTQGSFVFSVNNRPVEPRLLTYHFHRIRKKCGLEDVHFHQLRHTFATRCLEAQSDILSVSALLGHASTKLTLDTYADSMMDQRIQVIYQMENTIKNK
ncbi:tyrosine-type recombinase/integrase [Enterococcus gilvus]|uniref:tyrosine-type recombinase/integrase n=1 Tax=Enterococcus gilvus TaxID=160453 RepID=UPI003D6C2F29